LFVGFNTFYLIGFLLLVLRESIINIDQIVQWKINTYNFNYFTNLDKKNQFV